LVSPRDVVAAVAAASGRAAAPGQPVEDLHNERAAGSVYDPTDAVGWLLFNILAIVAAEFEAT
jgi:hypothetical protein